MKLQTFDFSEQAVRVVMQGEQPWFVAADVCRVLEIANSRDAVRHLDEDERGILAGSPAGISNVATTDIRIPNRGLQTVNESGLYALIFKSRRPEAKKFRKWVTTEVLPALRTRGMVATREAQMELFGMVMESVERLSGKARKRALTGIFTAMAAGEPLGTAWRETASPRWLAAEGAQMASLAALLGAGEHTAAELLTGCKLLGVFPVATTGTRMQVASRFGKLMARYEGRVLGGFRYEAHGEGRSRRHTFAAYAPQLGGLLA